MSFKDDFSNVLSYFTLALMIVTYGITFFLNERNHQNYILCQSEAHLNTFPLQFYQLEILIYMPTL